MTTNQYKQIHDRLVWAENELTHEISYGSLGHHRRDELRGSLKHLNDSISLLEDFASREGIDKP